VLLFLKTASCSPKNTSFSTSPSGEFLPSFQVRDWQTNLITRSLIYQGITRAQLHALVVNRLLREGWLEFLGIVRRAVSASSGKKLTVRAPIF
jgi:hypothetical protein